jgi:F-type H+-transporting ATPase subunit b
VSFLTNPQDAHFWVMIALVAFIAILWRANAHSIAGKALDDAGAKVQARLDEAKHLGEEAKALLAQINVQRAETERQAAAMLEAAAVESVRLRAEAAKDLEDDIRRMRELATRKIAVAEALATAEVKAAAADLASHAAETVLAARVAAASSDPMIDSGLAGLAAGFR